MVDPPGPLHVDTMATCWPMIPPTSNPITLSNFVIVCTCCFWLLSHSDAPETENGKKRLFFFVFKVDKQLWISLIFLKTKICLFLMINFTIFGCLVFRFANDNEFPAAPRNSNLLSSCVRNRLNVSVLVHILRRHNWPTFKRLHGPISLGQGGLVFDNNTSHGTSNQSNAQKECTQLSP